MDPMQTFSFFEKLQRDLDRFFKNMVSGEFHTLGSPLPAMSNTSISQSEHDVILRMHLPGMEDQDEVNVRVEPTMVHVFGQKRRIKKSDQGGHSLSSQLYTQFSQAVPLPAPVLAEKAQVQFKDGVLIVRAPKVSGFLPPQQ
jgi:HSP20 family protein